LLCDFFYRSVAAVVSQGTVNKLISVIALALLWLGCQLSYGNEPAFYIFGSYGRVHPTNPGGAPDFLKNDGWVKHVKAIQPQLDWAGPDAGILIINAFGYWSKEGMEIDSYDLAVKAGNKWQYERFAEAWQPVSKKHRLIAHVGNLDWHPRILAMPPGEQIALIKRNLKPYKDAGFHGICLDSSSDAILTEYKLPGKLPAGGLRRRTVQSTALDVIDAMGFQQRTAIEPTPRRFAPWKDLATRDSFIQEEYFQQIHTQKHTEDIGYGPMYQSWIKGRVHRTLQPATFGDDPARLLARAKEIIDAGDVPVVPAWFLMNAGYKPADFLEAE
jgi:hypothetical protein